MANNLENSIILRINDFYLGTIYPKIIGIRGTTWLLRNLSRLGVSKRLSDYSIKNIYSNEDSYISFDITAEESRKMKDLEDLRKYVLSEYRQSIELINRLNEDSVFYDVGGYHGYHTILGTLGNKVYTFEPDPENLKMLRENVKLNSDQNIELIEKPVWNKEEDIELVNGRGGKSHIGDQGIKKTSISLDSFIFERGETPPDIIKIDVEGAEYKVLKGAEKILKKYRPILIMEIHEGERLRNLGGSKKEIDDLLESLGYSKDMEIKRKSELHSIFIPE